LAKGALQCFTCTYCDFFIEIFRAVKIILKLKSSVAISQLTRGIHGQLVRILWRRSQVQSGPCFLSNTCHRNYRLNISIRIPCLKSCEWYIGKHLICLMEAHSPPLHALIVPSKDAHQSEYVSARDKRREYVSRFMGSAGLALITRNEALLWTDGRYFFFTSNTTVG
jgi:hypothetical protein